MKVSFHYDLIGSSIQVVDVINEYKNTGKGLIERVFIYGSGYMTRFD